MSTIKERMERCLSILRRLQRGAVDRDTLIDHVGIDLGADVYAGAGPQAERRKFEKDIEFLRNVLEVELPGYDRARGVYELNGFGELKPLCLREEELDTLAFLAETFQPGAPNSDAVQALLYRIQDLLTENQRTALLNRRARLQMDLRRKDTNEIHPRVEATVGRALSTRRRLRFAYISPGQGDGIPRVHTVEPWNRYFDVANGHYYLDAYRHSVDGPHGLWEKRVWQTYRLDRILADGHLQVLPDRLPPAPPPRPRHRLEYLLAPEIARLGVTYHFAKMEVHPPDADGWVRVVAVTHDLFRACRLLLSYGPGCRVVGGSEARREMGKLVQGLMEVYGV